MQKRRWTVWGWTVICLICSGGFPTAAQQRWSLEQCIGYALENNPNIRSHEIETEQAALERKSAAMAFLPSFGFSASAGLNWGRSVDLNNLEITENALSVNTSANLSAELPLYDGGERIARLKLEHIRYERACLAAENTQLQLRMDVIRAYLELLLCNGMLEISKESRSGIQAQLRQTGNLMEAGRLPYSACLEIEARLAEENMQVMQAGNRRDQARIRLQLLLGLDPAVPLEIEGLLPECSKQILPPDSSLERVLGEAARHPRIRQAVKDIEECRRNWQVSRAAQFPKVSLQAGYGTFYHNNGPDAFFEQFNRNRNPSLGFSLQVPLFARREIRTAAKSARLEMEMARIRLEKERQGLLGELCGLCNDIRAAYRQYETARQNCELLTEVFNSTRTRFDLGLVNATDYVLAKTNLFKARSELLQNRFRYIFQLKILDCLTGMPIK